MAAPISITQRHCSVLGPYRRHAADGRWLP